MINWAEYSPFQYGYKIYKINAVTEEQVVEPEKQTIYFCILSFTSKVEMMLTFESENKANWNKSLVNQQKKFLHQWKL